MEKEFEPLKKAFKKYNWNWNESEDLFKNMTFKNKGDMWLYNYGDGHFVDKNHPVIMKCRGLVVREDGKVLNYPFERFFNDFEDEKSELDWNSACIQEKVDGSLICVFWNGEGWEITTRRTFYPLDIAYVNFSDLFKKHFDSFHLLSRDVCYVFEIITEKNRIVKWYDKEMVYLLGARRLYNFNEIDNSELREIASRLAVYSPRTYEASNFEQCRKLFDDFKDDDEGLVVVDKNFNRVKVKQESYFKLSRIKMLKEQDLFDYILGVSEVDEEYLNKCPEVTEKINEMGLEWYKIKKRVLDVFREIKEKPTRKEFALEAIKYPFKPMLFSMKDGKETTNLKWKRVIEWLNTPKDNKQN